MRRRNFPSLARIKIRAKITVAKQSTTTRRPSRLEGSERKRIHTHTHAYTSSHTSRSVRRATDTSVLPLIPITSPCESIEERFRKVVLVKIPLGIAEANTPILEIGLPLDCPRESPESVQVPKIVAAFKQVRACVRQVVARSRQPFSADFEKYPVRQANRSAESFEEDSRSLQEVPAIVYSRLGHRSYFVIAARTSRNKVYLRVICKVRVLS